MKIVLISDTHTKHRDIKDIPQGDIIIHPGDITGRGSKRDVLDFVNWYSDLDFEHKVLIAGNHDFNLHNYMLEKETYPMMDEITFLHCSSVDICGIKIYGCPYTPVFFDWAYMYKNEQASKIWGMIPIGTDILVTHGPPYGIMDKCPDSVGCKELLNAVNIIKPKVHVFGHIHEGFGMTIQNETLFVNASILDGKYNLVNKPIVIDI